MLAMFDWLWGRRGGRRDRALSFRQRYASFRRLLGRNSELLNLFVELETDLRYERPAEPRVRERIRRILDTSLALVQDLSELTGKAAEDLFQAHERIEALVKQHLAREAERPAEPYVVFLDDPEAQQSERSGGKAARLAELTSAIPHHVPPGFAATTAAYRFAAKRAGVTERARALLGVARGNEAVLAERGNELRRLVESAQVPDEVAAAIAAAAARYPATHRWAVRSSGVGEDGELSFAGQFDTRLGVPAEALADAYRMVIASRFSDRALAYLQGTGLAEVETPMAVLFLPMIEARSAGILYTRDPQDPGSDSMWLSSTLGLGVEVVAGTASADFFVLAREPPGAVKSRHLARKRNAVVSANQATGVEVRTIPESEQLQPSVGEQTILRLARLGLTVENRFGRPQDIEWAEDDAGQIWILQARPLAVSRHSPRRQAAARYPVKLRGRPLAPGRAAGPVHLARDRAELDATPEGAVLVVLRATPDIARVLERVAALVTETGSPQSHAAALVRQADIPAIYGTTESVTVLCEGEPVGVDGTGGEVYAGIPWPGLRKRKRAGGVVGPAYRSGFAYQLILHLSLVDPAAASFTAQGCASVHDLVRLVHERALLAMFRLGDQQPRFGRHAARHLETRIPLDLEVLDLGGGIAEEAFPRKRVVPEAILSVPFRALWQGMADPRVSWAGRRQVNAAGFVSVLQGALLQEGRSLRRLGDRNYVIVAHDYLNLNARLAYHYALLDALVGEAAENNYVTFRFQGGGAGYERRDLRARFLADVMAALGFVIDRRGDLVNAWLRSAPRAVSEASLMQLGLLMACARQLDMLLDPSTVRSLVDSFLAADYERFA